MRKLLAAGLVTFAMAAATSAYAVPEIGIEIKIDNSPTDSVALTPGGFNQLTYTNSLFNLIHVTSSGVPLATDPSFGTVSINVSSAATFSGTHTLTLIATQTDLTGSGLGTLASQFTYSGNPSFISSSIGSNYVDAGDAAYAETTLIANTPNEAGQPTYQSPVFNYSPTPLPLFSETEVYAFTFTGVGTAQSTAQIVGAPEPMSLALLGAGLIGLGAFRKRRAH